MKQDGYAVIIFVITFLSASVSIADEYLWDQTNDYFSPPCGQGIQPFSPIGQEFLPSFDCLEVVQLYIINIYGAAELVVNIYSESITGTLIGTSSTEALSGYYVGVVTFSFDPISLVPHTLYVMEILQTAGNEGHVGSSGGPNSTYPYGCQILSGIPVENNDLWFRKGVLEGTALNRLSWGLIKNFCW
jgi:hypothetical protein